MADYIEREAVKRLINIDHGGYLDAIDCIPAADVVPVVHCKDCAHRTEMGNCGHPRYHGILPPAYPYDFCSYGERKEND